MQTYGDTDTCLWRHDLVVPDSTSVLGVVVSHVALCCHACPGWDAQQALGRQRAWANPHVSGGVLAAVGATGGGIPGKRTRTSTLHEGRADVVTYDAPEARFYPTFLSSMGKRTCLSLCMIIEYTCRSLPCACCVSGNARQHTKQQLVTADQTYKTPPSSNNVHRACPPQLRVS